MPAETCLLRVNKLSEELIDKLRKYFEDNNLVVFGVYEEGCKYFCEKEQKIVWKTRSKECNPHYHFWIESPVTEKRCKQLLVEQIPELKPSTAKSWSQRHKPSLRYLCKGPWATIKGKDTKGFNPGTRSKPMVVFNNMGITEDQIEKASESFWAQFSDDVVEVKQKEKKPTFLEVVRQRWDESDIKKRLQYEYSMEVHHDRWFVDRMCEDIAIWLMDEFKCLDKLDDLPIQRKYASLLFKTIGTSRELLNAWKSGRDSFFN